MASPSRGRASKAPSAHRPPGRAASPRLSKVPAEEGPLTECRSRCRACDADITAVRPRPPKALQPPRFYIEEAGGFNFSRVAGAVERKLGGSPPDLVYPVGEGQYLFELPLLRALAANPSRTLDPKLAAFHVLAVMPWTSYMAAKHGGGDLAAHDARMRRAATEVGRNLDFAQGKPFVLLFGGETLHTLGPELGRALARGNAIMACTDPTNAAIGPNNRHPAHTLMERAVALPYYAQAFAALPTAPARPGARGPESEPKPAAARRSELRDRLSGGRVSPSERAVPRTRLLNDVGPALVQPPTRPSGRGRAARLFNASRLLNTSRAGFMFHGGLGRFDFGNRQRMTTVMSRMRKLRPELNVDVRIGEFSRGNQTALVRAFDPEAYRRSGGAYQSASICLVPAGDVITSRRLFDALSAGCVPLLLRSWYLLTKNRQTFYTALPFPSLIDWQNITLRLVPAYSSSACIDADVRWLAAWHARPLDAMRRRGHRVFRRHMDYRANPAGVASALLLELAHSRKERQRSSA